MTLAEKVLRLRTLEGHARGLDRPLTQVEVSRAIREELGGSISQAYLSQIESGKRRHLTSETRALLARFFGVHPGHLVDDLEDVPPLPSRARRDIDAEIDLWLVDGSEKFAKDPELSHALVAIARHENSRDCLRLLASIVDNRPLIDRLLEQS
jgi:transcriptional regulator with XRE-family HTH domain